jgi:hypothetical protein
LSCTNQVVEMKAYRRFGLAVLVGLGLAGCGATQSGNPQAAPESGTVTATSGTATGSTTAQAPSEQTPSGKAGSTQSQQPASSRPGGQTSNAPAATVSISVVKQPTCPVHGTPDAPFSSPGTDAVISWKVTGANGAALAVDNPTVYAAYGTYGATGQMSFAFGCSGTTGKTTHSYTVWPAGIKNVSKTISVSATNNP